MTRSLGGGALVAVMVVAGIEAGVRLDDRARSGVPLTSPWVSREELVVRDRDGMHARPGAHVGKYAINALGTRGPAFPPTPPSGGVRLVTAGASETFGLYESPGQEFPRQLEDSLRAHLGCLGGRVEVLNTAAPGMSLPTVIQDLDLRVRRWRPALTLYYPSPAQYLADRPPAPARPDSGPPAGPPAFQLRSTTRLAEAVRNGLPAPATQWLTRRARQRLVETQPPGWAFADLPADRLARFEADLRQLVGMARSLGSVPVLMVHAHGFAGPVSEEDPRMLGWLRQVPRATAGTLLAMETAAAEVVRRTALDSGLAVVDVPAALPPPPARWFADHAHFTDAGAARVASATVLALAPLLPGCPVPAEASARP